VAEEQLRFHLPHRGFAAVFLLRTELRGTELSLEESVPPRGASCCPWPLCPDPQTPFPTS